MRNHGTKNEYERGGAFWHDGYTDGLAGKRDQTEMYRQWGTKAANAYAKGFAEGDQRYIDDQTAGLID